VKSWEFGWSVVDQGFASATTLLLMMIAARQLGPTGVGAVALSFAAYQVGLGLQRSLLIDPYFTRVETARLGDRTMLGCTITLTGAGGLLLSVIFAAIGLSAGDTAVGVTFLAFAPWLLPMLCLVLLRSVAFRSGTGRRAALASGVGLAVFTIGMALGLRHSVTELAAAWGLGASAGSLCALAVSRDADVVGPRRAFRLWRADALPFGRWLASGTIVWSACSYGLQTGLAGIAGTAALGGYRIIDSVFSPLSLLAPALANPGYRAMRQTRSRDLRSGLGFATRLSLVAVLVTGLYALIIALGREVIWSVYGEEFRRYASLIAPIAVGQVITAATIGLVIFLKVARKGRDTVIVGVGGAIGALILGLPVCALGGLTAAAWAIAAAGVPPLIWAIHAARRVGSEGTPTSVENGETVSGGRSVGSPGRP
jgi:O-antigen/teichoic acid export membrane protein